MIVEGARAGDAPAAERGAVGGLEAMAFGLLIFVAGTLLIAGAWGIVDGKIAASAAAREAARAYVESTSGSQGAALDEARAAAAEAMVGNGRDPARMSLAADGPLRFERCEPATFVASYRVRTISLPWIGGFGDGWFTASARHREVVDPFRDDVPSGEPGAVAC